MRPVILTGDSHLGPLQRGAGKIEGADGRLTFWPLGPGSALRERVHVFDSEAGTLTTVSARWKRNRTFSDHAIRKIGEDALLVVSLPLNTSRILRDTRLDTHVPWPLAREEQAISNQVLAAMIDRDSRHALAMVQDLARIWPRIAVIEAPRFFARTVVQKGLRLDVSRHVDAAYRAQVGAALALAGIAVIEQPSATLDPEGGTLDRFKHEDPEDGHHGNSDYGALALQAILRHADSLPTAV